MTTASKPKNVRVRFAPSPTGIMHLGNVRAALLNYLFAKQHEGTFVLRIEDTDEKRNFDPGAQHIQDDLAWLHLAYQEGPKIDGPYAPYFQSERTHIYQEHLEKLIKTGLIYRCFCSEEELKQRRDRQIALKKPPRYDGPCPHLTEAEIKVKLDAQAPYIWRMKVNPSGKVIVTDMARGDITFDLSNFSDFPLTRSDGSFTFIFANAIDDIVMKMTHVLRGEDHLSNTVDQVLLYQAFGAPVPTFWHLPILCNIEGKKLSKRDFGFSLNDLKKAGYLPEAINNYLAIIGTSFTQEFMALDELARSYNFQAINATGQIKYDVEKLTWLNHKWINHIAIDDLTRRCEPFIFFEYPEAQTLPSSALQKLVAAVATDISTLSEITQALKFYFRKPEDVKHLIDAHVPHETADKISKLIKEHQNLLDKPQEFVDMLKSECKKASISNKELYATLRLALSGELHGLSLTTVIELLGKEEASNRLHQLV